MKLIAMLLLITTFGTAARAVADTVIVATDGEPRIYLDVDPAQFAEWARAEPPVADGPQGGGAIAIAVNDFARCFEQMTGAVLPRQRVSNGIPLRLVHDRSLLESLGEQGCRIDVTAERVQLTAPTRLGLINGLYTLLDRWGCRWVMAGDLGEVIPQRRSLELSIGSSDVVPASESCMMYAFGGNQVENGTWLRRNRMGYDRWLSGQHYWLYAVPVEKYFKEHPEYFALIGGQRKPTQLCTTNPDVIGIVIEDAKAFLRKRPTAISYPMDPADNYDFCQCERCVALDPPGSWQGQPLLTDRVIAFANEVAQAIEAEFPDRCVALYAYQSHQQPPVNIKPRDNVRIIITRANYCYLHLEPTSICQGDFGPDDFERMVDGWAAVSDHLYAYEYNPIYWTGQLPCPIYLGQAEAVRRGQNQGIRSRHEDGSAPRSGSNFLNHYLPLRMHVDPTLDPVQELAATCHAFFGPAGEPMLSYYQILARVTDYDHPGQPGVGGGMDGYDRMFTQPMIREARAAMNEARSLTAEPSVYAERVEMVEATLRYLEGYLDGIWHAQAGRYDAAVAGFDHADQMIDVIDELGYMPDAADAHRRMTTARLKALARYFPDRLGFIRTWRVLGPFDNDRRDAIVRRDDFESDRNLTLAGPIKTNDDQQAVWRTYTSDGGFVSFEDAFAEVQRPWSMSYAYAAVRVHLREPQKVQFRMDSFNGFRVYLNSHAVYERLGLDADAPDKRVVTVDLPAGPSTIVVKVGQTFLGTSFHWGFYFRITDTQGNPVRGLRFQR